MPKTRRPKTPEEKKKLSSALKGRFKDKIFSLETRKKISEKLFGEKHPSFKAEGASLSSIHRYIRKRFPPPQYCQKCLKEDSKLDLANKNGTYDRDFKNYEYLCRKCHIYSDKRILNMKGYLIKLRKEKHDQQTENT